MKKILLVFTMLFITCIFLISCKKDSTPSSTSTSIVGTWEATTSHAVTVDSTSMPPSSTTDDSVYTHGHAPKITFIANGTYSFSDPYDDPPSTENGTYVATNGKLSTNITAETGTPDLPLNNATYTISGNTMTIVAKESIPGFLSSTATIVVTRQ